MDIFILILSIAILLPLAIFFRRVRERKSETKGYFIFEVLWFGLVVFAFFFFANDQFTQIQNIIIGAFIGGGVVRFFYKSQRIFKK